MYDNVAIQALQKVKAILDDYRIEYWLTIGTLLGEIRAGKFIC